MLFCCVSWLSNYRAFKIEISKVSGSALAAEICTGPHNRLLRRQHCSSLCSQSEGHEHVANMALLDFQPVLGRVFKIQKNLCAFFCQTTSGKACAHDKRTKREKERPERAASSEPRATPWVSVYKRLRPVRAKVWANGWLLLLPLQVGCSKSKH